MKAIKTYNRSFQFQQLADQQDEPDRLAGNFMTTKILQLQPEQIFFSMNTLISNLTIVCRQPEFDGNKSEYQNVSLVVSISSSIACYVV
jgi:hypothetical protein